MVPPFINLIFFVLFVRSLQDAQNHLLESINSSSARNFWMDLGTGEVTGRVIISKFSSCISQQRQALQVTDVWTVDEIILSAT